MRKPEDIVFPAGQQALYEQNRYSPAVKSGDFLFVSGQVGSREDGSAEPGWSRRSAGRSITLMRCWRPQIVRLPM